MICFVDVWRKDNFFSLCVEYYLEEDLYFMSILCLRTNSFIIWRKGWTFLCWFRFFLHQLILESFTKWCQKNSIKNPFLNLKISAFFFHKWDSQTSIKKKIDNIKVEISFFLCEQSTRRCKIYDPFQKGSVIKFLWDADLKKAIFYVYEMCFDYVFCDTYLFFTYSSSERISRA